MTAWRPASVPALIVVSALAFAALTGCTSSGPAPVVKVGQSKAAACESFRTDMAPLISGLTADLSTAASDPTAAVKKLGGLSSALHTSAKKITNAPVHAAVVKADRSFAAYAKTIRDMVKHPASADFSVMMTAATKMQTDLSGVDTVCK